MNMSSTPFCSSSCPTTQYTILSQMPSSTIATRIDARRGCLRVFFVCLCKSRFLTCAVYCAITTIPKNALDKVNRRVLSCTREKQGCGSSDDPTVAPRPLYKYYFDPQQYKPTPPPLFPAYYRLSSEPSPVLPRCHSDRQRMEGGPYRGRCRLERTPRESCRFAGRLEIRSSCAG